MAVRSAGVLLYRRSSGALEVLLVHTGGPLWRNKDAGAWQIPKGVIAPGESPARAARREAQEELGIRLHGEPTPLGTVRQKGGKIVDALALAQDFDPAMLISNRFEMEWPPHSGMTRSFPEVDAARWMPVAEAETMMLPSQLPLLAMLREAVED